MDSLIPLGIFAVFILFSMFKVLPDWERGVILRFGRVNGVKGPGFILLIPMMDRLIRIDTRTITMDIQPQDIITKDNVRIKVNAVVCFRVTDPEMAVTQIEDFYSATEQLSQTAIRTVIEKYKMDDLLVNKDTINQTLQDNLVKSTEPWGIKVSLAEVKHIDLPKVSA